MSGEERGEVETEGKKRSRTSLEKFRKKKRQGHDYKITFNKKGIPKGEGNDADDFVTYCAYLVKDRVPITIKDWKEVSTDLKDDLWNDVKEVFNIEGDDGKKKTLKNMGDRHRQFRHMLKEDYITNADPNNPENPCDLYPITQKQWDEFCAQRRTEEFQKKSAAGKELRKKFKMTHRMGSHGYRGAEETWKPDDIIIAEGESGDDGEGVTSVGVTLSSLEVRTGRYFRARAVPTEISGTYKIPKEDKETTEAFKRARSLSLEVSVGSISAKEVLSQAIGRPEHSGRMRGTSSWSKLTDEYDREPRKKMKYGMSDEQYEKVLQDTTELCFKRVQDWFSMMGIQIPLPSASQLRLPVPTTSQLQIPIPTALQLQNLQPSQPFSAEVDSTMPRHGGIEVDMGENFVAPYPIGDYQELPQCNLFLHNNIGKRIKVAEGIILPSHPGQIVHCQPLPLDWIVVQIDRVVDDSYRKWDLPGLGELQIADNMGGPIPWPKVDVEIRGQSNEQPLPQAVLDKEKVLSSSGNQKAEVVKEKVPSAGSAVAHEPLLDKDCIAKLDKSERSLYNMLVLQPADELLFHLPDCNPWGTHDGEVKFYVHLGDIVECLKRQCLNVSILKMYSWYWVEKLKDELACTTITIVDPDMVASGQLKIDEAATVNYLQRTYKEYPSTDILIPYFQGNHWIILLLNVEKLTIHYVDSVKRKKVPDVLNIRGFLNTAYKHYHMEMHQSRPTRSFRWIEIPSPKKKGETECGYFSMLAMKRLIIRLIEDETLPKKLDPVGKPYKKEEIGVVVEEIMNFMKQKLF